jgi:hypothetical protein
VYTLIVIIHLWGSSPPVVISSDFTSKLTCESARDILVTDLKKNEKDTKIFTYGCYKK